MDKNKTPSRRANNVETLGPVSRKKKSRLRSKPVYALLTILIIGSVGVGYLQITDSSQKVNNETTAPQENSTQKTKSKPTNSQVEPAEKKPIETKKPIVVFEPEGIFSEKEKKELMDKLVNPMADYTPNAYAAIHIEIYSQDKFVGGVNDDKYIVTTIGFEDDEHGGFLFGSKKKGLDYWTPVCLDACEFSEDFKQKYPEVVEKSQR